MFQIGSSFSEFFPVTGGFIFCASISSCDGKSVISLSARNLNGIDSCLAVLISFFV